MLREEFIIQSDFRRLLARSNGDYSKMKSEGDRIQSPRAKRLSFSSGQKPFPVRSMLVLHQGALGDFILALPSLEVLRRAFPQARSVFMGYPRILELIENRFYAEEILSIDQKGMASFFVRGGPLDLRLSQFFKTFDLIVVFGKNGEGNLIGNLNRVCEGRILHINPFPRWDGGIHLIDHLLMELSRYGFSASERIPKLFLNESDRTWGREYWMGKGVTPEERESVIILHPGSGSKKKVWPLDRFLKLTEVLQQHLSSKILVVLGPAEGPETRKIFENERPGSFILARGLSLIQLASVDGRMSSFRGERFRGLAPGSRSGNSYPRNLWTNGSKGLVSKREERYCDTERDPLFALSPGAVLPVSAFRMSEGDPVGRSPRRDQKIGV